MHRYTVIATNPSTRLVALRDQAGRCHVAHCTSDLPQVESVLDGALPAVGFALLLGTGGKVFRLIYSQVNCSQHWVMGVLHPAQVLPPQTRAELATSDSLV